MKVACFALVKNQCDDALVAGVCRWRKVWQPNFSHSRPLSRAERLSLLSSGALSTIIAKGTEILWGFSSCGAHAGNGNSHAVAETTCCLLVLSTTGALQSALALNIMSFVLQCGVVRSEWMAHLLHIGVGLMCRFCLESSLQEGAPEFARGWLSLHHHIMFLTQQLTIVSRLPTT